MLDAYREALDPSAAAPRGWASVLLAAHPGKRTVERLWLANSVVWGGICAVVMVGGFAERWHDLELMLLGVAVGMPAALLPLFVRAPEERGRPLHDTAGFKLSLSVVAFALLLNYSQTPFFFDVLHAHFGFHSTLNIRNNPIFLYLMTIGYFSTYAVLLMMAYRATRHGLRGAPAWLRGLGAGLSCVVIAMLESVLNANPFTRRLYCFDDVPFALWFGSLVYGLSFMLVLPVWIGIDERPGERVPWGRVLALVGAAVYADTLVLDLLRHHVAPYFTTVQTNAVGLGDVATSCLGRP